MVIQKEVKSLFELAKAATYHHVISQIEYQLRSSSTSENSTTERPPEKEKKVDSSLVHIVSHSKEAEGRQKKFSDCQVPPVLGSGGSIHQAKRTHWALQRVGGESKSTSHSGYCAQGYQSVSSRRINDQSPSSILIIYSCLMNLYRKCRHIFF